jgi:hypothetical protein
VCIVVLSAVIRDFHDLLANPSKRLKISTEIIKVSNFLKNLKLLPDRACFIVSDVFGSKIILPTKQDCKSYVSLMSS